MAGIERPIQDYYPDDFSYCYGCGRLNDQGLHLKSFWQDGVGVCEFLPRPEHIALPGYVYGGLIASLVDCHGTGTAAAAAYQFENRPFGSQPAVRFVTAALHVDYLKPTPLGEVLTLRARVAELKTYQENRKKARVRKVTLDVDVIAQEVLTARGQVVAVAVPENLVTH